ncbi:MAG: hypothetical protein K0Q51_1144 [Rickettsiaceae bacterium]|jgi:tetratricopeptide (TPR) repeat protein|nr:hypothetical protein [Rickettsiaceae bacterium]
MKAKLEEVQNLYEARRYKELITAIDDKQLKHPIEFIYYKGQAYYALKQYPKAIGCFEKVLDAGNEVDPDLINSSYYYKGNALYTLKKYSGAIDCYNKIHDDNDLSMCANLYKGFCYEQMKSLEYNKAEQCFRKVLELCKSSKYYDKDNIRDMAQKALTVNLMHQGKIDELIKLYNEELKKEIDEPDNTGNTLLMYATTHENFPLIKKLLSLGANPFKGDKYNNSSFSIALNNRNESITTEFLKMIYKTDEFNNEKGINFYMKKLIQDKNELTEKLQVSKDDAEECFTQVNDFYQSLDLSDRNFSGAFENLKLNDE